MAKQVKPKGYMDRIELEEQIEDGLFGEGVPKRNLSKLDLLLKKTEKYLANDEPETKPKTGE